MVRYHQAEQNKNRMASKTDDNWQRNYDGFDKLTNRDLNWLANYDALKEYIALHGHLPDKHRVEFRGLLNWALCGVQHKTWLSTS